MPSPLSKQLRELGLSEKSALVYAYLLEQGSAVPSAIALATKLNRSTVYTVLNDLKIKGLVTEIERGKIQCYQVEDPAKLPGIIKQQIQSAEDRYEKAKALLPELQGLFSLTPNKPRVRFFEGINGVVSVYSEHIQVNKPYEMLSYSNVEQLIPQLPKSFVTRYIKEKARLRITTRAIFPDTEFSQRYNGKLYGDAPEAIRIRAKYIPPTSFPFQADVTIFGDKVSIVNFSQNSAIGVIIEDKTIAGLMRMSFELAWKGIEKHK